MPVKQEVMFIDLTPAATPSGPEISIQEGPPHTITTIDRITPVCNLAGYRYITVVHLLRSQFN